MDNYASFDSTKQSSVAFTGKLVNKLPNYTDKTAKRKKRAGRLTELARFSRAGIDFNRRRVKF